MSLVGEIVGRLRIQTPVAEGGLRSAESDLANLDGISCQRCERAAQWIRTLQLRQVHAPDQRGRLVAHFAFGIAPFEIGAKLVDEPIVLRRALELEFLRIGRLVSREFSGGGVDGRENRRDALEKQRGVGIRQIIDLPIRPEQACFLRILVLGIAGDIFECEGLVQLPGGRVDQLPLLDV